MGSPIEVENTWPWSFFKFKVPSALWPTTSNTAPATSTGTCKGYFLVACNMLPPDSFKAVDMFEFGSGLEIGRASCRERVCKYVSISVVAVSLKKKKNKTTKY